MPRAPKRRPVTRPLSASLAHAEVKADGRWIVQTMAGAHAVKTYRCPACQAPIGVGVAHIVAWPEAPALGSDQAVDDRRHWHSGCWARRR